MSPELSPRAYRTAYAPFTPSDSGQRSHPLYFAGVVADRLDNRRLVIGTQTASMVISAALTVMVFAGAANVALVYALALAGGTALVFDAPGRHALTFQMVGREELPNAVALNASLFNASRVVGPAVAGVLIAWIGVGACFLVNTLSFVAVLVALLLMRAEDLFPIERADRAPTFLGGIREGLSYARHDVRVRTILVVVAVVSTVGFNFHVILPLLASDTLHTGPEVFGLLSAAFGGGALVGALLAAALGRASWKLFMLGLASFSGSLMLLAPVRDVPVAAALLFVTGIAFTLWSSQGNSILQLGAPDRLRGRVVSLFLFAFAGLAPLGGLLSGWLVDVGGTELSFGVSGATGLAAVAYAARSGVLHRPNVPATTG